MLPEQEVLSKRIKDFVDSQKTKKPSENPEQSFADGLAEIFLQLFNEAEIVPTTTSVNTTVTGLAGTVPVVGTGVGAGVQNNTSKII